MVIKLLSRNVVWKVQCLIKGLTFWTLSAVIAKYGLSQWGRRTFFKRWNIIALKNVLLN